MFESIKDRDEAIKG